MGTEQQRQQPSIQDIIDYELGELNEEQTVELFQKIIDTQLFRTLQGSYGRACLALIREGRCVDTHGDFGYR